MLCYGSRIIKEKRKGIQECTKLEYGSKCRIQQIKMMVYKSSILDMLPHAAMITCVTFSK